MAGKKALVIEDSEDNMKLITFILGKNGFTHVWADTGQKGIDIALGDRPDFIILDIQLPDMDGTEVLEKIRSVDELKDIPVIAMTSHAMSGDREKLLSNGCNGYIEKPIDPFTVIDQIKEVIGG